MFKLNAEKRDIKNKLGTMRGEGKLPAVFYGRKVASTPITVKETEFNKVWKQAGESSVVVISINGEDHESLIHDIDLDPVTGVVRHADFYILEKGKLVEVKVPLEFIGVSAAVKDLGGVLAKVLHELHIEAKPSDLPQHIEVDISALDTIDSQILAKDIKLPAGVKLLENEEEVIALVSLAKEEVEEEVVPVDFSTIEVEKRGKKEEEAVPAEEEK